MPRITQPERIGYVLEHLLAIEIESRGVNVTREERRGADFIKSDITADISGKKMILFVTHTRTTGMTNRKFYRTFEELAQKRVTEPEALCVNISLCEETTSIRSQYGTVFAGLFDLDFSVIERKSENDFIDFVKSLPAEITNNAVKENLSSLPRVIHFAVARLVDKLFRKAARCITSFADYWLLEKAVKRGKNFYRPADGEIEALKRGIKTLALLPEALIPLSALAKDQFTTSANPSELMKWYLVESRIVTSVNRTLRGTVMTFGEEARKAYLKLIEMKFEFHDEWQNELALTTSGAVFIKQMRDVKALKEKYEKMHSALKTCASFAEFHRLLLTEYKGSDPRCDLLDLALAASGLSQNQIALDIAPKLSEIGVTNLPPDMALRFLISKNEEGLEYVSKPELLLQIVASEIWDSEGRLKKIPSWEAYFGMRLMAFETHPYIRSEQLMLNHLVGGYEANTRYRSSVLPRLVGLPRKNRMSVEASYRLVNASGIEYFIKCISTPEPRHHKHKEFAGKLRAIRHRWDENQLQPDPDSVFIAILEGNWSEGQIGMMLNAGWNVYDWDTAITAAQKWTGAV